jgi:hypothetical protein
LTKQVGGAGMNIVDIVDQKGRTWRAYMEDYIGGCQLTDATGGRIDLTSGTTAYHSSHNPFVYYPDISGNSTRCANLVNANGSSTGYFSGPNGGLPSALLSDLNGQTPPNLMWLSPNSCNDGHDFGTTECIVSDPVLEQNNYLQSLVPMILNSNTFKNKPSALYITWDEGNSCSSPGQTFPTCTDPVATIWAGPTVRQGYQSSITYSHYNFIKTLERFWNLTPLPIPASINALPMLDFFVPNNMITIIRDPNNGILSNLFLSGSWHGWQSLPGGTASGPVLCSSVTGSVDLMVRGADNASLWHDSYSGGVWSAWDTPGGTTNDQPACASLGGVLYLVVKGLDNALWYNTRSTVSGTWSGWASLGGNVTSSPVLIASPANRLDLIVRGMGNTLWHKTFANGAWLTTWDTPGGTTPSLPVAVSDSRTLYLAVRGIDNGVWYDSLNFASGSWTGWSSLGGVTLFAPSMALDSAGSLHLAVVGTDGGIWHRVKPSSSPWSVGWDTPGGTTLNTPTLTSSGGNLFVVIRGADQGVWVNVLSGTNWIGWTGLGAVTLSTPVVANTA